MRLGSYCWSGMQCSCGTWVAPALQVVKSKVDEMSLVPRAAPPPQRPAAARPLMPGARPRVAGAVR